MKAGRTVICINLLPDVFPPPGYGGLRCRDAFLKALPIQVMVERRPPLGQVPGTSTRAGSLTGSGAIGARRSASGARE